MPKILIFESDSFLRNMYVQSFLLAGFKVANYETPGRDPVAIVLKEKPDIISMDIIMPETDDFTATQQIKADPRTKDIPLFFLTNMGSRADQHRGRALGVVEYLIKSDYNPSDVVNYVKSNPRSTITDCGNNPRTSEERANVFG